MATYKIDAAHSDITFKVKHLMISTVTGSFKTFDATLESSKEDFSDLKVSFEADINGISTNNEQRDEHLKSADFFDAAQFPKLTFVSTGVAAAGGELNITGELSIHGVTKPVTLKAEFNGSAVDGYGQSKIGFEATGSLSRKDFGLTWSAVTETGSVVVSDEVKLIFDVQFIKQA